MKVKQVASSLQVCMGAGFKWERLYRRNGLDGLRSRKPPGRLSGASSSGDPSPGYIIANSSISPGVPQGSFVVTDAV